MSSLEFLPSNALFATSTSGIFTSADSRLSKTFRILRALDLVGFFARRLEPGESALTDNLDLV